MSKKSLFFAAALAIALGTASGAQAADKISIMVGGVEKIIYLPAKLAEQLGYFKEAGLDVELLSEPAGVNAEDEMLAGAVQGVVGFYDHTVDLQAKGKFVESVVQFSQAPGEVELVSTKMADQIKSPADFKGKNLGVTGLGSSTNFLTQFLAVKNGVKLGEFTSRAGGRRQYLHRRDAARTDRCRDDDRTDDLAPAQDRRGQDPGRYALGGHHARRAWRSLSGGLPLHADRLGRAAS